MITRRVARSLWSFAFFAVWAALLGALLAVGAIDAPTARAGILFAVALLGMLWWMPTRWPRWRPPKGP